MMDQTYFLAATTEFLKDFNISSHLIPVSIWLTNKLPMRCIRRFCNSFPIASHTSSKSWKSMRKKHSKQSFWVNTTKRRYGHKILHCSNGSKTGTAKRRRSPTWHKGLRQIFWHIDSVKIWTHICINKSI